MIKIQDDDFEKARGATFLDDMDITYSPVDGSMVPVAMKSGVHVCWQCGEPFNPNKDALQMVEKRPEGSVNRVGVHRKCWNGPPRRFWNVVRGLGVNRTLAEAAKKSKDVALAAASAAKRVVG